MSECQDLPFVPFLTKIILLKYQQICHSTSYTLIKYSTTIFLLTCFILFLKIRLGGLSCSLCVFLSVCGPPILISKASNRFPQNLVRKLCRRKPSKPRTFPFPIISNDKFCTHKFVLRNHYLHFLQDSDTAYDNSECKICIFCKGDIFIQT